ncbi:DNA-directed RNA polymerase subunit omega ['Camptotheca acuminata' phytoplasma]|uniref:DNA-directed RNA polymerase subunit omega n=1 Tax='Camptotheca acuminata' phytoplasma TaxID=3239192 RepID=UPI003519E14C
MEKKEKEGLNYPSIDELLKKIDSKYKLVYLSSKISRIIKEKNIDVSNIEGKKLVTKALYEVINGNFEIEFE